MDSAQEYSDDNRSNEEETVYYVERILDKKFEKGKKFYLVKWQNFPEESATWEPEENLINLTEMIEAFERKLRKQKKKTNNDGEAYFDDRDQTISRKKQKESDGSARTREYRREEANTKGREPPVIGHLRYGDKPQEIVSIRTMNDPDMVLFRVRWHKRRSGIVPTESYVSNKDFMKFNPRFLLAFYQSKIRLRPFDNSQQMDTEDGNRGVQEEKKAEENPLLGNIEKEKNLPKSSLKSKRGFTNPLSEIQNNQEDDPQEISVRKEVIAKYSAARESEKESAASEKPSEKEKEGVSKNLFAEPEQKNPRQTEKQHEPEEFPPPENGESVQEQPEQRIEEEEVLVVQREVVEIDCTPQKTHTAEKEMVSGVRDSLSSLTNLKTLSPEEELLRTSEKQAQNEVDEGDKLAEIADKIPNLGKSSEEESSESRESLSDHSERYYY